MHAPRRSSLTGLADLTTRRTSLLAFSGAALASLARHPPVTEAKKIKNKARKRCQQQGSACQEFATRLCTHFHPPSPIRDACENRANACCASIAECQGSDYFDCLFDHVEDLVPV